MRKFLGYFLTFILALSVVVPIVAFAVPDEAEARIVHSLAQRANRIRTQRANGTWNGWGALQNFHNFVNRTNAGTPVRSIVPGSGVIVEDRVRNGARTQNERVNLSWTFR